MPRPTSSNVENILQATIDGTEYNEPTESRVEELLVELKETIEEGGGGGGGTGEERHGTVGKKNGITADEFTEITGEPY